MRETSLADDWGARVHARSSRRPRSPDKFLAIVGPKSHTPRKVYFCRLAGMKWTRRSKETLCRCGLCLALGLAALCPVSCGKKEETVQAGPPEVLVTEAAARDVPVYREWIGTIDGSENAEIRAKVQGYLVKRDYDEGALVKKGTLLF